MTVSFYYSVLPFVPLRQKGGVIFIFDREYISKPVKWFLSQNVQRGSLLVFWPHSVFGQNHLSVKMLKTGIPLFRVWKSEEFKFPVSCPDDRTIPSDRTITVPSVRTTCHPVRTLDRPASVRTKCSFRPDPILYREVFVPACIRLDVLAACPDAS
jgi:hypothetical protein